jgi:hypothetical protein
MLSLSSNHIAYICAVTVFAYSLRGATGFGAAATMPLMGLVVPIKVLVPAWSVLSLCAAVTILGRDRRNIAWTDLMRLVPSCMVGIALGLFFFVALESPALAQGAFARAESHSIFAPAFGPAVAPSLAAFRSPCCALLLVSLACLSPRKVPPPASEPGHARQVLPLR